MRSRKGKFADGLNLYNAYMGVNGVDPLGLDVSYEQVMAAYHAMYGENDKLLRAFLGHSGNYISMEGVWGDRDTDQIPFKDNYVISIENSLDNPFLAASYLRSELENDALGSDYTMRKNYQRLSGASNIEAYNRIKKAQFASAQQSTLAAMSVIEAGIGIANEGADFIITLKDLSEGQWTSAAGLLPFIPAGAGKVIFKRGDDVVGSFNASKLTKMAKGEMGELAGKMTMARAGFSELPAKLPGNRGFDGVWVKYADTGDIADIVIVESKYSSAAQLVLNQTRTMGGQMDNQWISANINNMLKSSDPSIFKTGELLQNYPGKIKLKANVIDPQGVNKWYDLGVY